MPSKSSLIALTAVAMLPSVPIAFADDGDVEMLDPVVVDARKWKEDLDKVPVSVVKVTKEEADSPTFLDLRSLQKRVPNVQLGLSTADSRFVVRGMMAGDFALQNPVGHFVNDIALPYGAMQAPDLFDVSSLEVIKGPQGTLYGRNTEAGALKVTTADPDWEPSAEVSLNTYFLDGEDTIAPGHIVKGRVSGPIIEDIAAVSLAVRAETSDGVQFNTYDGDDTGGDTDQIGFSTGLELLIGDNTTVTVKNVTDRKKNGARRFRYIDGANKTERFTTNHNSRSQDNSLESIQSVRIDHTFDNMDFTSISGWTYYDRTTRQDLDVTPTGSMISDIDYENNALSQEFRLSSNSPDARLKWLAGIYGFQEWADINMDSAGVRRTDIDQQGIATFGQLEYSVTDRLRIGVGTRIEHVSQNGSQDYTPMGGSSSYYTHDQSVTALLPKVSLSYDLTPKTMAYASYARGYLPGGYNYSRGADLDTFIYDPEYSWTAELGVKTRLLNDRLSTGLTFFHTLTEDKQLVEFSVTSSAWKIRNAGEAENYGLEFTTDYNLDANWSTYANLGLLHAEATSYQTSTADYSGNRLPMAANVTYGFGIAYEQDRKAHEGWFAEANFNGSGESYFNIQNTVKQDAYVMMDGKVGYRFDGAEISLWGTNLLDAETYDIAAASTSGTIVQDSRPRTVGLNLSMKF